MTGFSPVRAFGLVALLATATALFVVGSASAAKPLAVCPSGCPFTSIGAALDAASDGDRIVVEAGTYDGGLLITKHISLIGAGPENTTIAGVPGLSIEEVNVTIPAGVDVRISGFTIDATPVSGISMGIDNSGTLTLDDAVVAHASSGIGAGIFNRGTMALKATVVRENGFDLGAGIWNLGVLTVKNSLITENLADFGGGIINSGALTVMHTTVSNNTAREEGGGIFNGNTVTLKNVTFSNNVPDDCVGC
jgi:predicted outer membrane repeat protein